MKTQALYELILATDEDFGALSDEASAEVAALVAELQAQAEAIAAKDALIAEARHLLQDMLISQHKIIEAIKKLSA